MKSIFQTMEFVLSFSLLLIGLTTNVMSDNINSIGHGDETQRGWRKRDVNIGHKEDVCFPNTGCFSQQEPWVTLKRPFPKPRSPEEINVGFYLFTRNTTHYPIYDLKLNTTMALTLWNLDYQASRPLTVFIVHGFDASINSVWMTEMALAFLSQVNANIFLIDWENGSKRANYLQVASNTRVVGVIVARFIRYLTEATDLNPMFIHLVGHSLGGHICGYVGKQIPGIYRITALDLAQPGFEGADESVGLTNSDAQNVDVLHTNGKPTIPLLGLGYVTPVGHVDFYFNGGAHQPGCITKLPLPIEINTPVDLMKLPVEVISKLLSCSHSRATYYFIEAIKRTDCTIWGIQDNRMFGALNVITLGRIQRIATLKRDLVCALQTCLPVGLNTFQYPARGKFQVMTHSTSPYCIPDESVTESMLRQLRESYNLLYSQIG